MLWNSCCLIALFYIVRTVYVLLALDYTKRKVEFESNEWTRLIKLVLFSMSVVLGNPIIGLCT